MVPGGRMENEMTYDMRTNWFTVECDHIGVHEEFDTAAEADKLVQSIGKRCIYGPCSKCSKLPEDPTGNSDPGRRY